jgi:phage shock protein A
VVIKIAEGAAAEEDYAEVISQREAARASINELESQIEELKKQLDETN